MTSVAAAAPGQPGILAPLHSVGQTLAAERPLLVRLFHALGGTRDWFQRHAWTTVTRWEAHAAGLPAGNGAERGRLLTLTLAVAAAAAEDSRVAPAGTQQAEQATRRLACAQAAAFDLIWRHTQRFRVADATGSCWDPAVESLRSWRSGRPAPHRLEWVVTPDTADPWGQAAEELARAGIWVPQAATGRWLLTPAGWALLWPLAGHDLQRAHLEASGCSATLAQIVAGLHWWGYLIDGADAGQLVALVRANGRTVQALPVGVSLWRRAGFQRTGAAGAGAEGGVHSKARVQFARAAR